MKIDINRVVTVDSETFYSTEFSLTKKELNTSSYIRDPQFKEHCWGIKIGKKAAKCYTAEAGIKILKGIDWSAHYMLAHNTSFDGFILSHHHGIVPHFYLDTLSMTRGLHADVSRAKLDTIAKLYGIGAKSETYLTPTKGLRDLPKDILKGLMDGCKIDVDLCFDVFCKQLEIFPEDELELIDTTIRMFCDSKLEVDIPRAKAALQEEMMQRRAAMLKAKVSEEDLMSNPKFAAQLRKLGVEPPVKISLKTGHENFAFAQTDPEFLELLDHEDKRVVLLAQARLAAKSTQVETRAARLIQAGDNGMKLPAGYNYYAAKTGRWGGTNKLNLQNLPRGSELRRAIVAPPGHVLVVSDSAQIEARTLAWLAGQQDILDLFANKRDVYKHMATAIYGKPEDKITKDERFVGKVCLAEGTLIYSDRGWIEIQTLQATDKLWDGDNWVCHQGLAMNGCKETLNLCGLWLTPGHLVWSGTQWSEAQSLARGEVSLSHALACAAESSPSQAISEGYGVVCARSSSGATVEWASIPSSNKTSRISKVLDVISAQSKQAVASGIGSILKLCRMTLIGPDYLTVSRQLLPGVTHLQTETSYTMERGELRSLSLGEKIVLRSSSMFSALVGGIGRSLSWIGETLTKDTSPATFDLSHAPSMQEIKGVCPTLRRKYDVYDVLSVGPKNRFLALTQKGPLLVHNCVLGLGYGMGAKKFQTTLELGAMGPPMKISAADAQRVVKLYRSKNMKITQAWKEADMMLNRMVLGESGVAFNGVISYDHDTIWLPNGMPINYPALHRSESNAFKYSSNGVYKYVYGGLVVENITQALARIIVGVQALDVKSKIRTTKLRKGEVMAISMLTHDEMVNTAPERLAEAALKMQLTAMRIAPPWCKGMPLDADGGFDHCYSK